MKHTSDKQRRRSIRLSGFDYSQNGAYFVTICSSHRKCVFGEIVDDAMQLNTLGCIADACWEEIPEHFPNVELDVFAFMPNHMHGIIVIRDDSSVVAPHAVPLLEHRELFGKPVSGSLATIVRSFKSAATRQINRLRNTSGAPVWQRNYYEHIIRNEDSLNSIKHYVQNNPARWARIRRTR